MQIDRERQAQLEREKKDVEAELSRFADAGTEVPNDMLEELRDRIRAIDDELTRMEFATEIERQSDA
jgi:hypothetical protein